MVHGRARERHGDASTPWQETYSYSDGSGHEVMRKVQAEPEDAPARDANGALLHDAEGALVIAAANPRWVGTGKTVLDNKGNPVKQYEPFFSATFEYEDEAELVEWGVTPILRYDPLGRLIRTDLPNGTFSKVVFDPWKQTSFDPNDTVTESLWYAARQALAVGSPERRASDLSAAHAGTPAVAHLDALGRTFLTEADNGAAGVYATRVTLDIEGNPLVVTDARGNEAMRHVFAMGGRKLYQKSCDAGERWMLQDVAGQALRGWDGRGYTRRAEYDALRRGTHHFVQKDAAPEFLAERVVYGEGHASAAALNLRGKVYRQYDGAGAVTNGHYDFKGNLLSGERRVAVAYATQIEWSALVGLADLGDIAAAAESLLETEVFSTQTAYDALNRPVSLTTPDSSEVRPTYNEASLLEKVDVRIRGAAGWTSFVDDIDYDAKGQRERIEYGNGTATTYSYDPLTFRLARLRTVRASDGAVLQNLAYTYDPVGNITAIADSAQQTVFFNNDVVTPSTEYVYDAIYRLIRADGREHAGGIGNDQRDQNDVPLMNLPHANDSQALRNYTELYGYDAVGNILSMIHQAGMAGSWTRRYEVAAASNRLLSTSLPGDGDAAPYSAGYGYDEHGNMTSMPHLSSVGWDHKDQMQSSDLGGGGVVYYTYDAAGQRVRKVWEHSGLVEERIYLGGYEVYRKRDVSGLLLERQTLHVMDGVKRVALVETKTVDTAAGGGFVASTVVRFQMGNHLGSAALEVDGAGAVISYEEYHPYGTTAYRSGAGAAEVGLKRYRYTGKEKDEGTGLYYHGARYYACWLGRWTNCDPKRTTGGSSLYWYASGNPVLLVDPDGRDPALPNDTRTVDERNLSYFDTAAAARTGELLATQERAALRDKVYGSVGHRSSGPPPVPVLAALIPSMGAGGAVRPSSGADHPAVAAYRNLTGSSALHTQQTTGGAAALITGMSVGAAVGMRYFPAVTPDVVRLLSKPISEAMHFEDPAKLERVVMDPARKITRVVKVIEKLLTPPEPMKAQPGQVGSGSGGGWTSPPPGVDAAHYKDLGTDPDVGGKWRQNEADTALKVEQVRGVSLTRYRPTGPNKKGDWVDQSSGDVYDGCSPPGTAFFDAQLSNGKYQSSLVDHVNHPNVNHVVVDTSGLNLTQVQQTSLDGVINGLTPAQRAKIVRVR